MIDRFFSKKKQENKKAESGNADEEAVEDMTFRELKARFGHLFQGLDKEGKERYDAYRKIISEMMQQPENKQNIKFLDLMGAMISEISEKVTHLDGLDSCNTHKSTPKDNTQGFNGTNVTVLFHHRLFILGCSDWVGGYSSVLFTFWPVFLAIQKWSITNSIQSRSHFASESSGSHPFPLHMKHREN